MNRVRNLSYGRTATAVASLMLAVASLGAPRKW